MKTEKYVASIERQIREHQQVQMTNPPSSEAWQNASTEINRLAALIVAATKDPEPIHGGLLIRKRKISIGAHPQPMPMERLSRPLKRDVQATARIMQPSSRRLKAPRLTQARHCDPFGRTPT
jgi:hypothetical protein